MINKRKCVPVLEKFFFIHTPFSGHLLSRMITIDNKNMIPADIGWLIKNKTSIPNIIKM